MTAAETASAGAPLRLASRRLPRAAMSGLHTQLGALAIAFNALAALLGGFAWLARRPLRSFWTMLRGGQALIMVEAVVGAALLLDGQRPAARCT